MTCRGRKRKKKGLNHIWKALVDSDLAVKGAYIFKTAKASQIVSDLRSLSRISSG